MKKTILHIMKNLFLPSITITCLTITSLAAANPDIYFVPTTAMSTSIINDEATNQMTLRKIYIPGKGTFSASYQLNNNTGAWEQIGALSPDDKSYIGLVQVRRNLQNNTENFSFEGFAKDLVALSIKSPKGITYNCSIEGPMDSYNKFKCQQKNLSINQKEFTNGAYTATYTLTSGVTVSRTYYQSGSFPFSFSSIYPKNNATNVSTTPILRWKSIGAGFYRLAIYGSDGNTVYQADITNSTDAQIKHNIPMGILSPNTTYILDFEAYTPMLNGGWKGLFPKQVSFTTQP